MGKPLAMNTRLNILALEDSPSSFQLLHQHLVQEGIVGTCQRCNSTADLFGMVDHGWDVVLANVEVTDLGFRDWLSAMREHHPDLPVLLVANDISPAMVVNLMRLGLSDFVHKDRLHRLVPAILRAHDEARERAARRQAEAALRASEERYRSLASTVPDAMLLARPDGTILNANQVACAMFGRSEEELVALGCDGVVEPSDARRGPVMAELRQHSQCHVELTLRRADGSQFEGEMSHTGFLSHEGEARCCILIRDVTQRKLAEERLRQSESQLHALTAHLQAVREDERTRIAREVHDVLGQLLTGLTLDMAWLQKRLHKLPASDLLQSMLDKFVEVKQLTDTMIQSVQEISSEMRPSVLDNLGLCAAIRFEARRFRKRTGITCGVEVPNTDFVLGPERVTGIFRIYQEILTNVARHASATHVGIHLLLTDSELELEVQDNGCGITLDQLANPSSLGLLGMHERADQLGGRVVIRSKPGTGTSVTVEIPL